MREGGGCSRTEEATRTISNRQRGLSGWWVPVWVGESVLGGGGQKNKHQPAAWSQWVCAVCRSAARAYRNARYGAGPPRSPLWLDDVQCRGSETRLLDCPARPLGTHNCVHGEDAAVSCGEPAAGTFCPSVQVSQWGFTSTETVTTVRDGQPRTSTSTFIQLLSSVRPQRP